MANQTDEGGGSSGGGSTTTICTINPSDNVAVINNLISRISDIERFLSQLVGADVHADNLSELAANIGNILNGTIVLPGDANSPYGDGGSIPVPDDFTGTVISGNVMVIWTNGVVSFELINGEQTAGSGLLSTALFQIAGGAVATGPSISTFDFTTLVSQSFVANNTSSLTMVSGLYLFTLSDSTGYARTGTAAASVLNTRCGSPISGNQNMGFGAGWASGEATTSRRHFNASMVARFPDDLSGTSITATGSKTGSPTIIAPPMILGISRIGA